MVFEIRSGISMTTLESQQEGFKIKSVVRRGASAEMPGWG
jgi:hypothetical protein